MALYQKRFLPNIHIFPYGWPGIGVRELGHLIIKYVISEIREYDWIIKISKIYVSLEKQICWSQSEKFVLFSIIMII